MDGVLREEYIVILTSFSQLIATKIEEPPSQLFDWSNYWIEILVAKSYSHMVCGARLPSPLQDREPDWDPGLGLNLAQYIVR